MFLLLSFALSGFAHSSILDGRCRSSSLLQTGTRDGSNVRTNHPDLTLENWKKLFPSYSLLDLDEMSDTAVAVALNTCSTTPDSFCDGFANGNHEFNKSAVWKMLNPSVYATADGSMRTLALLTNYNRCQCADSPKKFCAPDYQLPFSGLLVSCGADDGCTAVGPGLDPHSFQFQGHPMAFTNHGPSGVCHPKLLNLTSFEMSNLTLPGMSNCEKNWQAFTHNGTLFFSQWLQPEHKVLRCNVETTSCEAAFNTSTSLLLEKHIHGGTPYVELDSDHWVAGAHHFFDKCGGDPQCDQDAHTIYEHMFFAIQRQPPFAVVARTEWFMLPVKEGFADAEWVGTQYAGGLMRQGQDVILSYGVGDCMPQAARISVEELKQALGL